MERKRSDLDILPMPPLRLLPERMSDAGADERLAKDLEEEPDQTYYEEDR